MPVTHLADRNGHSVCVAGVKHLEDWESSVIPAYVSPEEVEEDPEGALDFFAFCPACGKQLNPPW
jgi:hypothetical protein